MLETCKWIRRIQRDKGYAGNAKELCTIYNVHIQEIIIIWALNANWMGRELKSRHTHTHVYTKCEPREIMKRKELCKY